MPARMRGPFSIAEIRDTLLPYRASRRHVGVDSMEDYEFVLLRFVSGESNLASLDDADLLRLFQRERNSSNPDLSLLTLHGKATVTLTADGVARIEASTTDEVAPPPPAAAPASTGHVATPIVPPAAAAPRPVEPLTPPVTDVICLYCGGPLPSGREVKFCPHCGQNQLGVHCPGCQTEADPGWKHCVSCGATLPGWS